MTKLERDFAPHCASSLSWFRVMVALSLLLGLLGPNALAAREADPMTRPECDEPKVQDHVGALSDLSSGRTLVPVGRAVGIKLFSDGVMVVGFSQIPAGQGTVVPAKACGLKELFYHLLPA